jgi:FK506-binding nuclear protein
MQTAAKKIESKMSVKESQISEAKPRKVVKNGLIIEDLVGGSGVACTNGNGVGMYYTGRLKTSKKAFDSCKSGKPFRFKLGAGTVIQGWDIGLQGIKVRGKRRLTIPSAMGYGKRGAPPDIPPNSTLVFDVECKFIYGGNQY